MTKSSTNSQSNNTANSHISSLNMANNSLLTQIGKNIPLILGIVLAITIIAVISDYHGIIELKIGVDGGWFRIDGSNIN